jgi:hypothetical protein
MNVAVIARLVVVDDNVDGEGDRNGERERLAPKGMRGCITCYLSKNKRRKATSGPRRLILVVLKNSVNIQLVFAM